MIELPPVREGFIRIHVEIGLGGPATPGELAGLCGVALDHLGPIAVEGSDGVVEVAITHHQAVRRALHELGPTRLVDWQWRWLKLNLGRNHGLTIGHFRKVMQKIEAYPLGKIGIQNTHTLVGIQDFKLADVVLKLSTLKVNGYLVRPEVLPPGKGPGSAAFGGP